MCNPAGSEAQALKGRTEQSLGQSPTFMGSSVYGVVRLLSRRSSSTSLS
jgi:hypothetical protein